jgi:hypothetical protein
MLEKKVSFQNNKKPMTILKEKLMKFLQNFLKYFLKQKKDNLLKNKKSKS